MESIEAIGGPGSVGATGSQKSSLDQRIGEPRRIVRLHRLERAARRHGRRGPVRGERRKRSSLTIAEAEVAVAFQIEQDGAGCSHTDPCVRRHPEFFVLVRADVGHRVLLVGRRGQSRETSGCAVTCTPLRWVSTAPVSWAVQIVVLQVPSALMLHRVSVIASPRSMISSCSCMINPLQVSFPRERRTEIGALRGFSFARGRHAPASEAIVAPGCPFD